MGRGIDPFNFSDGKSTINGIVFQAQMKRPGQPWGYLVSESDQEEVLDNDAVKRIKEIQNLPPAEKDKVISVVDALIRDYKTKQAYQ
ncbi:MAG: hypothetical protein K9H64_21825 [Bacteroidales bacterium]|nr:hypothetical protein [Bacteroidales bacterium]MCF8458668.1 hypothetical protein [Bacteroidales bacterium]